MRTDIVDTLTPARSARKLPLRLTVVLGAAHAVAALLTALVAPRLLLLPPEEADRVLPTVALGTAVIAPLSAALAIGLCARLRPLLEAVDGEDREADPRHVELLYALPSLLALGAALVTLLLGAAGVALHVSSDDSATGAGLAMLFVTLSATSMLAAYVAMRAHVARVLERVRSSVTEAALERLGPLSRGRVGLRFLGAVAAPVALVALGSSLLVVAHARAYDIESRTLDIRDAARAALTPVHGKPGGRREALIEAEHHGLVVRVEPLTGTAGAEEAEAPVMKLENGRIDVTMAVGTERAVLSSAPPGTPATTAALAVLSVAAAALAGLLGARVGQAFDKDLALARRELRRAGVRDAMRGSIILHQPRFSLLRELLAAVDRLGLTFRAFASAQRRATESTEAAERMRGLFLASISHDLKGPLNAILGFSQLAQKSSLSDAQQESLSIIEQRGRELLSLVDTILDSARAEAGELEISPGMFKVDDMVMSAVLEARELVFAPTVQIRGEVQPGLPQIHADAQRVVQALAAVIVTASRFTNDGVIPVRAALSNDQGVRIDIETRGDALPLAERAKLFDAFHTAESARKHGSLGLGLALARAIIVMHAGTIRVSSSADGGLLFRVTLPVRGDIEPARMRASLRSSFASLTDLMVVPPIEET